MWCQLRLNNQFKFASDSKITFLISLKRDSKTTFSNFEGYYKMKANQGKRSCEMGYAL